MPSNATTATTEPATEIGTYVGEALDLVNPISKAKKGFDIYNKGKKWKCDMKKLSKTAKKTRKKKITLQILYILGFLLNNYKLYCCFINGYCGIKNSTNYNIGSFGYYFYIFMYIFLDLIIILLSIDIWKRDKNYKK